MKTESFEEIMETLMRCAKHRDRCLVAIAGPPGVGKSTLSARLQKQLVARGLSTSIVQMDGFHLDNTVLEQRKMLDRKGAPETFDASAFVWMIARLRSGSSDIRVPEFDRNADCVRHDSGMVAKDSQTVLIEGNYLLLNAYPWSHAHSLFDCSLFLTASTDLLEKRLVSRWLDLGLDRQTAETKAFHNDIPNAMRVLQQSRKADIIYQPSEMA
tara:strand:+ start:10567 stop:11205 length:639 start_codon:yes stop_codon:yes gene_type:complete